MKKHAFIIMLLLLSRYCFANGEDDVALSFKAMYGELGLKPCDSAMFACQGQPLKITMLKFYVSQVCLLNDGLIVYQEPRSYHLLNAAEENTMRFLLPNTGKVRFNQIRFSVGIDSATNISGAMGGDLDPTKGMYWAWQSGYINFKLEGQSPYCDTRHHEFAFHIGGYHAPYAPLQTITLNVRSQNKNIAMNVDLLKLMQKISLRAMPNIMSPGVAAYRFSSWLKEMFYVDEAQ